MSSMVSRGTGVLAAVLAVHVMCRSCEGAATEDNRAGDAQLKLVVAVFRHGVRAPLYRLTTTCRNESGRDIIPCEMSLAEFNRVVGNAIGDKNEFLSTCGDGRQVCSGNQQEGGER